MTKIVGFAELLVTLCCTCQSPSSRESSFRESQQVLRTSLARSCERTSQACLEQTVPTRNKNFTSGAAEVRSRGIVIHSGRASLQSVVSIPAVSHNADDASPDACVQRWTDI